MVAVVMRAGPEQSDTHTHSTCLANPHKPSGNTAGMRPPGHSKKVFRWWELIILVVTLLGDGRQASVRRTILSPYFPNNQGACLYFPYKQAPIWETLAV